MLYPLNECQEGHRAEIAEDVFKEDWENLLKVNSVLGPQPEYINIVGSGGLSARVFGPINITNQGGNMP